jgi:uncharacterized protein
MNTSIRDEEAIQKYVAHKLKEADIAHGWNHTMCVVNLCRIIGKEENVNYRILIPASYFHDIKSRDKAIKYENFRLECAKEAENFLSFQSFGVNEIESTKETIITAAYEWHEIGNKAKTIEAKVLYDADTLDAIGAIGIAREFAFAGYSGCNELGKFLCEIDNPVKFDMNLEGIDVSPIYHFFSKLIWLKDSMYTKKGKEIALGRHNYMIDFLKRYELESKGMA